jgi:hypothetical protein
MVASRESISPPSGRPAKFEVRPGRHTVAIRGRSRRGIELIEVQAALDAGNRFVVEDIGEAGGVAEEVSLVF